MEHDVRFGFRVYGDNIVEAEHIVEWLTSQDSIQRKDQVGRLDIPTYVLNDSLLDVTFAVQLCPEYDRWESNVDDVFIEKPDAVVTYLGDEMSPSDTEEILFAFEDSSATQVGNQTQQRFRRANDACRKEIPYIYQIDLCGAEFNMRTGEIRGLHYQKPKISIGHLSLMSRTGTPSFVIYRPDMWTTHPKVNEQKIPDISQFSGVDCGPAYLTALLREALLSDLDEDTLDVDIKKEKRLAIQGMLEDMFRVSRFYSTGKESQTTLTLYTKHSGFTAPINEVVQKYADKLIKGTPIPDDYQLHTVSVNDFKENGSLFKKQLRGDTETVKFREEVIPRLNAAEYDKESKSVEEIEEFLDFWGVTVDSPFTGFNWPTTREQARETLREAPAEVPTTYKSNKSEFALTTNRTATRDLFDKAYDKLSPDVLDWISSGQTDPPHLLIIPFSGLQKHGYSDPDTGLLFLLRALLPELARPRNTLVVIYSEYTPHDWPQKLTNETNMLWRAIARHAGCIIADRTETGVVLND